MWQYNIVLTVPEKVFPIIAMCSLNRSDDHDPLSKFMTCRAVTATCACLSARMGLVSARIWRF